MPPASALTPRSKSSNPKIICHSEPVTDVTGVGIRPPAPAGAATTRELKKESPHGNTHHLRPVRQRQEPCRRFSDVPDSAFLAEFTAESILSWSGTDISFPQLWTLLERLFVK